LCFIDDPHQQLLFDVGQFCYVSLDLTPYLGTPKGRLQPKCQCQPTVDIYPTEVGFRQVNLVMSVRVERFGQLSQDSGFTNPRFTGEQADTGAVEQSFEACLTLLHLPVIP
jgi:hypothetical protein